MGVLKLPFVSQSVGKFVSCTSTKPTTVIIHELEAIDLQHTVYMYTG